MSILPLLSPHFEFSQGHSLGATHREAWASKHSLAILQKHFTAFGRKTVWGLSRECTLEFLALGRTHLVSIYTICSAAIMLQYTKMGSTAAAARGRACSSPVL